MTVSRKGGRGKTVIDKYHSFTISMHPDLVKRLDLYKIEHGLNRSEILADLVERYLPDTPERGIIKVT